MAQITLQTDVGSVATGPASVAVESEPPRPARQLRVALLLIILAGSLFRVAQYLARRSFWEDEAFLVLNLRDKNFEQLLGPLTYNQAAPPMFLLAERATVVAWGASEYALRLIPLLAGIASLVVMAVAARRISANPLLGSRSTSLVVLTAVALLAASDRLISRAVEVKPYAFDSLAALILLALALPRPGGPSAARRLAATSIAAAVLFWWSYPTLFDYAGLSLAMLPAVIRSRSAAASGDSSYRRGAIVYLAWNGIAATSFLLMYFLVASRQQTGVLSDFWMKDFGDPLNPVQFMGFLASRLFHLCHTACMPLGVVLLPLAIGGGILLLRVRQRQLLALLTLPLLATVVASCAQRYPFDGKRMTTFLVPSVLLLVSIGLAGVVARLQSRAASPNDSAGQRRRVQAALAVLLAAPAALCIYHLAFPRTRAHVRPAVAFVADHYQPGDEIYCAPNPAQLLCYWPPPDRPEAAEGPRPEPLSKLNQKTIVPTGRFWVVFAYAPKDDSAEQLARLLAPARAVGEERKQFFGFGGSAYLLETPQRQP